jgi:hypothetical protein
MLPSPDAPRQRGGTLRAPTPASLITDDMAVNCTKWRSFFACIGANLANAGKSQSAQVIRSIVLTSRAKWLCMSHTLSQLVPFAPVPCQRPPCAHSALRKMSSITAAAMLRASGYRACLGTAAHVRVGVAGACVRAASSDSSASGSTNTGHAAKGSGGLYPGHVRTSTLQKGLLAVGSAVSALLDPTRCVSAAHAQSE